MYQDRGQLQGVDCPIEADADAPEKRQTAQSGDKNILRSIIIERQMIFDALMDNIIDDDASDESNEQDAGRQKKMFMEIVPT